MTLSASSAIAGNRVDWHENNGDGTFTIHTLDAAFTRAHTVKITDLDSDGDALPDAYEGGIPDVNGDGWSDFVIGAPGDDNNGSRFAT